MAIVKMNKFTLLTFESQKEKLLEALQNFEGVEFINLQEEQSTEKIEEFKDLVKDEVDLKCAKYEENLSKLKFALNFLQRYIPQKSGVKAFLEDKKQLSYRGLNSIMEKNSWENTYSDLKEREVKLNTLSNERTKYETEIKSLELWRNFDAPFKYLKEFKKTSYFIGTLAKQYEQELVSKFKDEIQYGHFEILNSQNQDIYIFAMVHESEKQKAEELLKNYGFSYATLNYEEEPRVLIENYSAKIKEINKEEEIIVGEIKQFISNVEELQLAYEYYNNLIIRNYASNNFLRTNKIVTICGWIALENNKELEDAVIKTIGQDYYLNFSEVSEEEVEKVPIKLKNGGFSSAFESLVEMYSLPLYSEVDPTPILSVFYFIFFGMMLSDAGYGLIMVIASAYAIKKVKDPERRKTFKLFLFAGISTMIWGTIYGGWFGDLLNYFGIKPPMLIDPTRDISQIFILSLAFGVIHVFVGLGIKAYILIRAGKLKDAIYDVLTWYLTLIGAILMLVGIGGSLGKWLLIVGLVGLLLTQGRTAPSLGGKIGGGLYGVYGITGYLGDIVSYSRLLALGLATGFIANALNLIVSLFPVPIKYILSPILFVGLHLFNLVINALGSYVHAARLQYLEFFGKFYEGGGKKFTPFKLSEEYIKITK
ncbi:V-type ATP synthase subunit I [Haloimpatiens lingqiaonensis]|uniref:V-type ATP synthase subunit I n=1 Tax=Haloimpatiens lingqiaonensis TaxID=1380675 RepID=UPI0010FD0849|nr:V-type ATP synthase subunit I [Haloimpatiens lingqiaonensis]